MPACGGQAVGCGGVIGNTPELWRWRRGPVCACACTRVYGWCRRIILRTYTALHIFSSLDVRGREILNLVNLRLHITLSLHSFIHNSLDLKGQETQSREHSSSHTLALHSFIHNSLDVRGRDTQSRRHSSSHTFPRGQETQSRQHSSSHTIALHSCIHNSLDVRGRDTQSRRHSSSYRSPIPPPSVSPGQASPLYLHLKHRMLWLREIWPSQDIVYFEAVVHESTTLSSPLPTCIAHTVAIRLHDYWAIYHAASTPLLNAIHHLNNIV